MANLISGIMNLAAQYSQRQQQQENNTQFGAAAGDESPENGVEHDHDDDDDAAADDDDIQIDTSINFTVNGQELPPEIAGLMGSVLQMFSGVNGAPAGSNHPTTPDPPGGAIWISFQKKLLSPFWPTISANLLAQNETATIKIGGSKAMSILSWELQPQF